MQTTGNGGARRRGGGFTLVEMALAMTILLVALMSISAATLRAHSLRRQNRDRTVAANALRSVSEQIHALSMDAGQDTDTWAETVISVFGPGGTHGDTFDVRSLTPISAEASVGTITIVTNETLSDLDIGGELGMPRDLDGDSLANNTNVSATARLLPVLVTVRWVGTRGEQRIDHPFYIMGY